jgi:hypothetical protein
MVTVATKTAAIRSKIMALKGSCHCKATQFEVPQTPDSVTQCTCSFCSKRGALHAYYPASAFRLTTARDRVSTYQWRSFTVNHHHCAICGCPTYSESLDFSTGQPDFANMRVGVNARLFDDLDLAAVPVKIIDGKNLW